MSTNENSKIGRKPAKTKADLKQIGVRLPAEMVERFDSRLAEDGFDRTKAIRLWVGMYTNHRINITAELPQVVNDKLGNLPKSA